MTIPGSEFTNAVHSQSVYARSIEHFEKSKMSTGEKLVHMGLFISRQSVAKFLCYADVMRMTEGVTGSIVESGVYHGNGLMLFAKLAVALEPYNYPCRVIRFDTFEGNAGFGQQDEGKEK